MSLPPIFPKLNTINEYKNPAVRLYGNRFFIDQTVLELLAEFLAVVYSKKNIGKDMDKVFYQPLPPLNELQRWFRSQYNLKNSFALCFQTLLMKEAQKVKDYLKPFYMLLWQPLFL